ncbi:MAG: YiaA/YiaB family inner membrane protein [Cyanobacteria bacterium P01_A01_bin.123]
MNNNDKVHSSAWIAQAWISFVVALSATALGLIYVPLNTWAKAYLAISTTFAISSTISVSKTTRDVHESRKVIARVDEARVERLLAEHDTLNTLK